MRSTIIGAGGYVGSRLAARLAAMGGEVLAPARNDPALFAAPLGQVYYCAGLTADYARRPHDTIDAHAGLINRLLRDGRFDSLVYLSSTRLYDHGGGGREEDDLLFNPANPRHIYDLSKALGESACLVAGGGAARVARLACVYGGDLGAGNFLHAVVREAAARTGLSLALDTAPDTARDYVHIDDVIDALMAIAGGGRHGIYNVAGGVNVTNKALLAAIADASGCRITATGSGGTAAPAIDVTRLADAFGIRPRPVLDAIPELVRQARAHGRFEVAS